MATTAATRFSSIDAYIASVAAPAQAVLAQIRQLVRAAVPAAQETIGYNMPALKLKRTFFYFAAFKEHVGIYPPVRQDAALILALQPYRGEKGNLFFPLGQPMPYELIRRVAVALAHEHG